MYKYRASTHKDTLSVLSLIVPQFIIQNYVIHVPSLLNLLGDMSKLKILFSCIQKKLTHSDIEYILNKKIISVREIKARINV